MTTPSFLLTKTVPVTVYRYPQGSYVEGKYVKGTPVEIIRNINIQPYKPYEISILPESERTKAWFKVYCAEDLRTKKEGTGGYEADEFIWQGDRYRIMKVENFAMGVLDHFRAHAARIPLTPN